MLKSTFTNQTLKLNLLLCEQPSLFGCQCGDELPVALLTCRLGKRTWWLDGVASEWEGFSVKGNVSVRELPDDVWFVSPAQLRYQLILIGSFPFLHRIGRNSRVEWVGTRHAHHSRCNIKGYFSLEIRSICYAMTAISPATCGTWGLVFTVGYLAYRLFISSKVNYPPGPRPYPVIGNPFDIPPTFQEVAFAKLAKKYGAVSLLETLYQA
jgi:hypothetical protein